ncbi:alpha/beta hydrolase [Aureisphaera galaxeae]|uniref:alpha/beta hydrolase family protein n=1 Tax=Aureisphaera galaxeae TaxID=1538023 RepID=UPI00234FBB9D|nr:alpha/beta hydrolase [Aureisphaera galaxeae]MDC8006385.1 alpha/beta hydrolase [Aureisphaera galaxeae]
MYKRLYQILFLLCLAIGSSLAQSNSEEQIAFASGNETLVGYLSKPSTHSPFPVIVVLHSASHGHHDNDLYNHLEATMKEIGVGVFTYDRRGSGQSTGDFRTASLETLAKDALSAIHCLKERKDIDPNRIGLYGISQGGWLAPLAYSMDSKNISFMVLVSSSGVSPARQMEYSAVTTLKRDNRSDTIIETAKYLRNITNEYYRGNRDRERTQKEIDQYRGAPWFSDVYLPWRGNLPEDVGVTKWIHEMDFNPKEYFGAVNVPILLVYGETDRWVPIQESIAVWKDVFSNNSHDAYDILKVHRAGHMMIHDEDNNPEREVISEVYTNQLKTWVLNLLKTSF